MSRQQPDRQQPDRKQPDRQQPDRLAVRVARMVHQQGKPLATILFGSRARGDHQDRSDIDLMLVTPDDPLDSLRESAADWARSTARRVYGREMDIQTIWMTQPEFLLEELYLNSVSTQAVLHGMVLSERPEDYRSRYAREDPPAPRYQWETYEMNVQRSRAEIGLMTMLIRRYPEEGPLRVRSRYCIEHALRAAIAGTGDVPSNRETLLELEATLTRLAPFKTIRTTIPLRSYQDTGEPLGLTLEEIIKTTGDDAGSIREIAAGIRSQTVNRSQREVALRP